MSKAQPRQLKRKTTAILFEKYIRVCADCIVYFGVVLTFRGPTQRAAFLNLLENLEKGNLPISQKRVLELCHSASENLADILKRSDAWRFIVRDGRGNVWLYVPDDIVDQLQPQDDDFQELTA